MLGFTTALNAVSEHATCTVAFGAVSFLVITLAGSIKKIHNMGSLTVIGFISIFTAIMLVTIASAVRDRPAAAPQTGDYDHGFHLGPVEGVTLSVIAFSYSQIIC